MTENPNFSKDLFSAAQHPVGWLLSAERLRDAAEIVLRHEVAQEVPYFRTHSAAVEQAMAEAYSDGHNAGVAEVGALLPNILRPSFSMPMRSRTSSRASSWQMLPG